MQASSPALSTLLSVNPSSFILRKQFNFRSKYNLVNLLRDLENNLRDFTKSEISSFYFTFKRSSTATSLTRPISDDQPVFDDEQMFLKETLKPNSAFWHLHSDLHFLDEFDHDIDFANLKRTRFAQLHDAMSRSENLIITINAEYGSAPGPGTALASANSTAQPTPSSGGTNLCSVSSYNRVPSFGSARDKEQQQQQQQAQSTVKIE